MSTKNLIPRADGEGGIGIDGTAWGSGVFNTGFFEEVLVGGSNVVLSSDFGTALSQYVNKSEIFIGADGNVGIGTSDPSDPLTIHSPTTPGTNKAIRMYRGADDPGQFLDMDYRGITVNRVNTLANPQSTFSIFQKGSDGERNAFKIGVEGNVGIGASSPDLAKLQIEGDNDLLRLISTRDGVAGAEITLVQNSNSPADEDAHGLINFIGNDTDGADPLAKTFSSIRSITHDAANSVGRLGLFTRNGSSFSEDLSIVKGNVGIGIASPDYKLHVDGDVLANDINIVDSEGNPAPVLTADKLGLATSAVLENSELDIQFKLLTDENRFVVGTSGNAEGTMASGWYRFNDFQVKGATDVGYYGINPVDTRIYSDESSFILFKTDVAGNRVAHLVGGDEEVSANNAVALGIAVKVDSADSPEDVEFTHTDGESYSVINGNSDTLGTNGLPIRQGFQSSSLGSAPAPLLIDGGSF